MKLQFRTDNPKEVILQKVKYYQDKNTIYICKKIHYLI